MAENQKIRTTYNILEEVKTLRKEHSETNDKSADITNLIKEAITLLPSSVTPTEDMQKLENILRNCKKILSSEQKEEINQLRLKKDNNNRQETVLNSQTRNDAAAGIIGGLAAYAQKREDRIKEIQGKNLEDLNSDDFEFLQTLSRQNFPGIDKKWLEDTIKQYKESQNAPALEETSSQNTVSPTAESNTAAPTVEQTTPTIEPFEQTSAQEETNEPITVETVTIAEPISTKQEEISISFEERQECLKELQQTSLKDYLKTISPKISKKNIEASLELETVGDCATALSNPDDMLVALDYYENTYKGKDKEEKLTKLKEAVNHNLRSYQSQDITPLNATPLFLLADKIKNEEDKFYGDVTYNMTLLDITTAQKRYDLEHFGAPRDNETKEQFAERLNQNYTDALTAIQSLEKKDTDKLLEGYTFVKDDAAITDSPVVDSVLARLKHRNREEELKKDIIETASLMVATDLIKKGALKDIRDEKGQIIKSTDAQYKELMAEAIAQIMVKAPNDTSKTYTYSDVASRLGSAMVTKPETFKTRVSQKFQGLPIVKTINGKWQTLDKKLEKNYGKPYRIGKMVVKTAIKAAPGVIKSGVLFAVAGTVSPYAVSGLIVYNTIKQWKAMNKQFKEQSLTPKQKTLMIAGAVVTTSLGALTAAAGAGALTTPAISTFAQNTASMLGTYGRMGISTIAASLPNLSERISLALKGRKLNKALELAKKENNSLEIARLTGEKKKLAVKKNEAINQLIQRGVGVALGLGFAQAASATMSSSNATASMPDHQPQDDISLTTQPTEQADTLSIRPEEQTDSLSVKAPQKIEMSNTAEPELSAEEKAAENLKAAQADGSGHNGKSDYDSITENLSHQNVSISPENAAQIAQKMGEIYGDQSYEAAHAALAEPNVLAKAMGLEGSFTSASMLEYLQNHPECANNEGLHTYITEHFDSQDRFHYTQTTVVHEAPKPTEVYGRTPPPAPEPAPAIVSEGSFRLEPVDHLPGERTTTVVRTEPQVIRVQAPEPVYIEQTPVPDGWRPLSYEEGFTGEFKNGRPINIYDHLNTAKFSPVIYTNDEGQVRYVGTAIGQKDVTLDNGLAVEAATHVGGDAAGIYRNNHHGIRVCHGSGTITHTTVSSQDFGTTLGQHTAARATDIALNTIDHALHHLVHKITR